MLTTILVPVDGSALARRAVPYALALARAVHGRLILMRATPDDGAGEPPQRDGVVRADLRAIASRLRARGAAIEAYLYPGYHGADAADAIVEAAVVHHADLIVMSTHGRGGLERWIYGSVAERVLRRAALPVLLVPAGCTRIWPRARRLRVLVPLDGSALAEAALLEGRPFLEALQPQLLLLQVVEVLEYAFAEAHVAYAPAAELTRARGYLEVAARDLPVRDCSIEVEVGSPATTIARMVDERDIDLVVMATHGRGGVARLVLGSVVEATLRRAGVPVLLVRPASVRAAGRPAPEKIALGTQSPAAPGGPPPETQEEAEDEFWRAALD